MKNKTKMRFKTLKVLFSFNLLRMMKLYETIQFSKAIDEFSSENRR